MSSRPVLISDDYELHTYIDNQTLTFTRVQTQEYTASYELTEEQMSLYLIAQSSLSSSSICKRVVQYGDEYYYNTNLYGNIIGPQMPYGLNYVKIQRSGSSNYLSITENFVTDPAGSPASYERTLSFYIIQPKKVSSSGEIIITPQCTCALSKQSNQQWQWGWGLNPFISSEEIIQAILSKPCVVYINDKPYIPIISDTPSNYQGNHVFTLTFYPKYYQEAWSNPTKACITISISQNNDSRSTSYLEEFEMAYSLEDAVRKIRLVATDTPPSPSPTDKIYDRKYIYRGSSSDKYDTLTPDADGYNPINKLPYVQYYSTYADCPNGSVCLQDYISKYSDTPLICEWIGSDNYTYSNLSNMVSSMDVTINDGQIVAVDPYNGSCKFDTTETYGVKILSYFTGTTGYFNMYYEVENIAPDPPEKPVGIEVLIKEQVSGEPSDANPFETPMCELERSDDFLDFIEHCPVKSSSVPDSTVEEPSENLWFNVVLNGEEILFKPVVTVEYNVNDGERLFHVRDYTDMNSAEQQGYEFFVFEGDNVTDALYFYMYNYSYDETTGEYLPITIKAYREAEEPIDPILNSKWSKNFKAQHNDNSDAGEIKDILRLKKAKITGHNVHELLQDLQSTLGPTPEPTPVDNKVWVVPEQEISETGVLAGVENFFSRSDMVITFNGVEYSGDQVRAEGAWGISFEIVEEHDYSWAKYAIYKNYDENDNIIYEIWDNSADAPVTEGTISAYYIPGEKTVYLEEQELDLNVDGNSIYVTLTNFDAEAWTTRFADARYEDNNYTYFHVASASIVGDEVLNDYDFIGEYLVQDSGDGNVYYIDGLGALVLDDPDSADHECRIYLNNYMLAPAASKCILSLWTETEVEPEPEPTPTPSNDTIVLTESIEADGLGHVTHTLIGATAKEISDAFIAGKTINIVVDFITSRGFVGENVTEYHHKGHIDYIMKIGDEYKMQVWYGTRMDMLRNSTSSAVQIISLYERNEYTATANECFAFVDDGGGIIE